VNPYEFSGDVPIPSKKILILQAIYIVNKKTLNIKCGYEGSDSNWFENIEVESKEEARDFLDKNGARDIGLTLWL